MFFRSTINFVSLLATFPTLATSSDPWREHFTGNPVCYTTPEAQPASACVPEAFFLTLYNIPPAAQANIELTSIQDDFYVQLVDRTSNQVETVSYEDTLPVTYNNKHAMVFYTRSSTLSQMACLFTNASAPDLGLFYCIEGSFIRDRLPDLTFEGIFIGDQVKEARVAIGNDSNALVGSKRWNQTTFFDTPLTDHRTMYAEHIDQKPNTHLGCYVDDSDRIFDLEVEPLGTNGPIACEAACRTKQYSYFGLQMGTQCFCGGSNFTPNDLEKAQNGAECDVRCPDDSGAMCGGTLRMNVYELEYDNSLTLRPNP